MKKAEQIYNKYFRANVDDVVSMSPALPKGVMKQRIKRTIIEFVQGNLDMGVHVAEITAERDVIIEVAYYGAGGSHDDLE